MFTLRNVPSRIRRFPSGRISTVPREIYPQGFFDDFPYQDLSDFMLYPLFGIMAQHSARRNYDEPRGDHKETKWVKTLKLDGFTPDDVKISTNEGRVLINARSVKQEGHDIDIHEVNRVIPIPEEVDIDTMKSRFNSDGLLTIEAKLSVDTGTMMDGFTEVSIKRELKESSEQISDDISQEDSLKQSVSEEPMEGTTNDVEERETEESIVE